MSDSFLPLTLDEMKDAGWQCPDIVIVSGDAYIDHPSFGTAVIGRVLEHAGYKVVIVAQPNWRDDLRDFRKFGAPRLFFGVTSGVMDSMVNHYTAAKRLRHDDAYTPGGVGGFRPDRATYVYSRILKQLYPDTPVVIGGVEASMRRLAHYDYWDDALRPSILVDTPADLLVYGMAERTMVKIADMLDGGASLSDLTSLPQVAYLSKEGRVGDDVITLHPYARCKKNKRLHADNFQKIELESNKIVAATLQQEYAYSDVEQRSCSGASQDQSLYVVVNPPEPPMTKEEMDASFDLPYQRLPHPKYKKRGDIPAFEMVKNSITTHRGCFGGCSFCTISAHQGKQIASRSERSIMQEIDKLAAMDYFHGVVSDLGGPSANMYCMSGKDKSLCQRCPRYSCIQPSICPNLQSDHQHIIDLYKKAVKHPAVKHLYIGSGIRCDLFTDSNNGWRYFEHVVLHHVSGRLKVAPEHTEEHVVKMMRKPSFDLFKFTKQRFDDICRKAGLKYQLIPYFISSHPGCTLEDMVHLAEKMKAMGYRLEQTQDFTPTPMTLSTEMYYTGYNPATMQPVYVARSANDKKAQNMMFFCYKRELHRDICNMLRNAHLGKYIPRLGLEDSPFAPKNGKKRL